MASPPPRDVAPADLWALITQTPRPSQRVPFPRVGPDGRPLGEVVIWVLHQEERSAATLAAERHVRKVLKDAYPQRGEASLGYDALFEDRASVEILFRACRRAENVNVPAFPSADEIARALSTDEVAVLMRSYLRVQAECGPIVADMSQEMVDAWIDVLASGGSKHPLDSLSSGALTTLLWSMACRLYKSRTDKRSRGPQPEESTAGESD